MKIQFLFSAIVLALALTGCGASGPSEADLQAEAEASRLDSINTLMEQASEKINEDAAALDAALDSLDLLFPEGE